MTNPTSYTDERVLNPWREFVENVVNGDNFFRTQEYYNLLEYIDGLLAARRRLQAQCEAEAVVAGSYFDQIKELQAEVEALRVVLLQAKRAVFPDLCQESDAARANPNETKEAKL